MRGTPRIDLRRWVKASRYGEIRRRISRSIRVRMIPKPRSFVISFRLSSNPLPMMRLILLAFVALKVMTAGAPVPSTST